VHTIEASDDEIRAAFEAAHRDATTLLLRDGQPEPFAVWALATVRRQRVRELRCAVLDGVMAAMDDDEIRRDEHRRR
jgi:hypothetical protein